MDGTVYPMTQGAIFDHWVMLPEEGATFFSMALEAILVDRPGGQRFRTDRTMRAVAVGTGDLALAYRVCRGLVQFRTYLGMAAGAHIAFLGLV